MDMSGGTVIVNGPEESMNAAVDYGFGDFNITGGILVAVGSSGMAQAPGSSSTQCSVLVNFNTTGGFWPQPITLPAGTLVRIQDSTGADIVTFESTKQYQSIAFSSSALVMGSTYDIYYGGSSTGTVTDGLYSGGTYTPGTYYDSFTISEIATTIGASGVFWGGGGFWGGGP